MILTVFLSGCLENGAVTKTSYSVNGKYALLIGIENYRNVPRLRGALNDMKLIQGVLRERFDFQDKDFIILLDNRATHSGIENAFKTLIGRLKVGDFVYIHYSGHGSQTIDLNGDEQSGYDQTWVSYGAREGGGDKDNYDVLDDEINAWLAEIYAKTKQVIFVSDSCHSGTVARGQAPIGRGLERDEREHPLGKMAYSQIDNYHGIRVGAAQDKELAAETIGNDGKHYGLFTWHWAKALREAQVGETWANVFKRAHASVILKRGQAQTPQMEGEQNRQIFKADFEPLVQTVSVIDVKGERVEIQAGAVAGVTVGSIYHLSQSAGLEITKVEAFKSVGKTLQGRFKVGDVVIEKNHAYHFEPIKVYVSADFPKDKPLLQSIKAAFFPDPDTGLQSIPGYILTDDPYNTDLRLHLLRPKRVNSNQPPELWVLTPEQRLLYDNLQIQFSDSRRGLKLLVENLNKLARIRDIKALQSRPLGATLPVVVQGYIHTPVKSCSTRETCVQLPHNLALYRKRGPYPLQDIETLNKNDILSFTLYNQSDQDYYFYLINLSLDGAIYAIFPDPKAEQESARLKAGEKRDLNYEVLFKVDIAGEEIIKLIASSRPINVLLLEQEVFRQRNDDAPKLNPLEQLLVNAAYGERGLSQVENIEWVTGEVTFEVR
ncbi:hypothetical protein PN36_10085 [Candidatus Thiomargarita nelsonii]|uniref:Peptidase C14 caspase domain-containing protein n=1 Tax=Candidatus Thiomargarita nelsonii TaxID=1003181 RepID=A0A4E0QRK0_9GAMM|nr:hypothetical protein PN36_10085 [Candidatus Thiomargarita nelsonii]